MLKTQSAAVIWSGVSELPLDWNGHTTRPFASFEPDHLTLPVAELLARAVRRNPTRIALEDGESRLSYLEVWQRARKLALCISRRTAPGELIGILLPTGVPFEVAMLACFIAGRPFAPFDLHYPKSWISNVLDQAKVKAIIAKFDDELTLEFASISAARIDIRDSFTGSDNLADTERGVPLGPDEPVVVLFTSGSTGQPKGIVNSQRNLLRRVEQHINAGHITEDDRFMPLSSGCTIAGMRERLTSFVCGGTLHCIDVQRAAPGQILETIHRSGISIIYALPALLRSLAQMDAGHSPASLRIVRVGGEAVLWSDIDQLRAWLPQDSLIQVGYSSSEAPIMQWFVPPDFPREGTKAPIGYPLTGNFVAILDEEGQPVAAGEVGELVVRSPYVALGQWVEARCLPDPFPKCAEDPSMRICHSGDLVRLGEDGLIDLVGRKDRQLKIKGQRIEPAELEAALLSYNSVLDAAALPRSQSESITIVAYVVLRTPDSQNELTALSESLVGTLPAKLQPTRIYAVAAIPRLPSGKLDLEALRTMDRERERHEAAGEPVSQNEVHAGRGLPGGPISATENVIAAVWSRLLGKQTIGRNQDYFRLGGDSLKSLQLIFEIEKMLGVQLSLPMIHQFPTIASLSRAVEERIEVEFSPLVLIKKGSPAAPPFFIVHGGGGTVMELFPLGRAIDWPGAVYAIQARGMDGKEPLNRSVAEMADYYVSAIREKQPDGPYRLCGYSWGGVIAFEMARRVRAQGGTVAFLGLLDATTSPRQWPLSIWVDQMMARLRHHLLKLWRLSLRQKVQHIGKVGKSLWVHVRWRLGYDHESRAAYHPAGLPESVRRVRDAITLAVAEYKPGLYSGTVTLFCSRFLLPLKCDPSAIWKDHASCLRLNFIPGDHRTMITGENGMYLADVLSDQLAKSNSSGKASNSSRTQTPHSVSAESSAARSI